MMWSAIKLPDGLRSFTELRICGTSSVCCGDTFRTPSASGLTSCPSFSFSATSGVGGSSSNCIFRSSAASSDFNCFSSSSFFHTFPAISYNCETSFSCTSFFALYWSMMDGILSNAFRKLRAAATGSAIASMQPMSYKDTDTTGEPVEHVTEPDKQIAHSALGDYTIQCEICHEGLSQLREQKVPHIDSDFACYRWKQRQYARGGRAIQK